MTAEIAILKVLGGFGPTYLLPEQVLWHDVNRLIPAPLGLGELRMKLRALEAKCLLLSQHDDLDATTKYRLTPEGRAELAARS